jgi:hypothetical protein
LATSDRNQSCTDSRPGRTTTTIDFPARLRTSASLWRPLRRNGQGDNRYAQAEAYEQPQRNADVRAHPFSIGTLGAPLQASR